MQAEKQESKYKKLLFEQLDTLLQYESFINMSIVDFFVIPNEQRQSLLKKLDLIDIEKFINSKILPLTVQLKQQYQQILNDKKCKQSKNRVSQKKTYQVDLFMSFLNNNISNITKDVSWIVDVGCGQGYLTQRIVNQFQQFSVLGVDFDENQIKGAFQRKKINIQEAKYDKLQYVHSKFDQSFSSQSLNNVNYGIVSLHGCGVLFQKIVQHFLQNQNSKFFIAIPCCYNRMQFQEDVFQSIRPMSFRNPQNKHNFEHYKPILHYRMQILACQITIFDKKTIQSLIYRSLFQKYCVQTKIILDRVGKINTKSITSFQQYLHKVLVKKGIKLQIQPTKQLFEEYQNLGKQSYELFFKIWTIRCWLGVLAESMIVTDRMHYLQSQPNVNVQATCIYDRKISPRNMCIFATKSN